MSKISKNAEEAGLPIGRVSRLSGFSSAIDPPLPRASSVCATKALLSVYNHATDLRRLRAIGERRGREGSSVASRRPVNKLISPVLFVVLACVVEFITSAFTDSWVWPVVAGVVAGAVAE
jgi:hypothetical protein